MTSPTTQKRKRKLAMHHVTSTVAAVLFVLAIFYPDKLNAARNALRTPLVCAEVVQLGDISVGKVAQRELSLLNVHFSSVKIKQVDASCGCTVAETSNTSVAPWHHGKMTISVTPSRTGEGSQTVKLETSRGVQSVVVRYNAV